MKVLVKGVVVSPDEPVKSGSSIGEKRSRGDIIVGFYCSLEICYSWELDASSFCQRGRSDILDP